MVTLDLAVCQRLNLGSPFLAVTSEINLQTRTNYTVKLSYLLLSDPYGLTHHTKAGEPTARARRSAFRVSPSFRVTSLLESESLEVHGDAVRCVESDAVKLD